MKQIFLLLLPAFLFFSCNETNAPHFPPDKMQAILQDIHLAESYSTVIRQDSLHRGAERDYDSLAVYYQTIFRHYHTDDKEFEQSLTWYKQHPEELDSIYIRMIDSLTRLENKFQITKP